MSTLIIEATSKAKPLAADYSDTSIVHCRNSIILKEELGAELLDGEYALPAVLQKQYDTIVCCYASPYMPHVPYRALFDRNPNARWVWLVNDHDVEDNQLLRWGVQNRGITYDMVCNNPREGYRGWILRKNIAGAKLNDFIVNWLTVNLNALIMQDSPRVADEDKEGVVYYGTFRKWREESFRRFLTRGVTLSASEKNWKKFEALGCGCSYIPKLGWARGREELRRFRYSIYIEDEHTHSNYAFLANRFYEALMADCVVLFDSRCANTIRRCGYDIHPATIVDDVRLRNGVADYADTLEFEYLLEHQRTFIPRALEERRAALEQIRDFLSADYRKSCEGGAA